MFTTVTTGTVPLKKSQNICIYTYFTCPVDKFLLCIWAFIILPTLRKESFSLFLSSVLLYPESFQMNPLVIGILVFQTASSTLAIFFNSFLIIIICTCKNHLGFYKIILTSFAVLEILYSLIIIVGMPILYITKQTWVGMNIFGPLFGGRLAKAGPRLYCLCYEIWVGFITFNFLYRYVIVCRCLIVRITYFHFTLSIYS